MCELNIWHAYYLHPAAVAENELPPYSDAPAAYSQKSLINKLPEGYTIERDLDFAPTATSQRQMQAANMVFRRHNTGFSIWIKAKPADTSGAGYLPLYELDAPFKLIIPFRLKNSAFVNFTNISLEAPRNTLYYFSNKAANPHHEMIGGVDQRLFLFLNTGQAPKQYITEADRVPWHTNSKVIKVSAFKLTCIRFEITCKDDPSRTWSTTFEDGISLDSCTLPLQPLPPGLYEQRAFAPATSGETEIPELREVFYRNNGDIPTGAFGIIEIFHTPDQSLGEYSLTDAQGRLQSPVYTLWWQNRMTKWRYLFNTDQPEPDTTNSDVEYDGTNNNMFRTKATLPLSNQYRKVRYQAQKTGHAEIYALPNPDAARVYPDKDKKEIYSEIHMGNFNFHKL